MTDDYLRVSYSSLNTFESCPRKFEFSKLFDRRPWTGEEFAAAVGTALHKGYQEYLVSNDRDKALWAMAKAYPHELEWTVEASKAEPRSLAACAITLDAMIDSDAMNEWEVAQIKNPQGEIVPAIEVPYEIRFK